MRGSEFMRMLPEKACPEREEAILRAVADGHDVPTEMVGLDVECDGHTGTVFVGSDVLRIGDANDYVRVNVTAATAQRIADLKGWILPTTRICDLLWRNVAVRLEPSVQPADPAERKRRGMPTCSDDTTSMCDSPAMLRHSRDIDTKRQGRAGLLENGGKHWVLTNGLAGKPDRAANYGYFTASAPYVSASGLKLWQPLGFAHNLLHTDYSQTLRPVHQDMLVDGKTMRLALVAADPALCGLVSTEGPLKLSRYPAIPPPGEPASPPRPALKPPPTVRLSFQRTLRRGMYGDDVAEWQAYVGCIPDRRFGPITESITRAWQETHGLVPDGVVGPKTVAKANELQAQRAATATAQRAAVIDDFVPARNFSRPLQGSRRIDLIVVHTAEAAERATTAEALAAWAAGKNAPRASWHYAVDCDSVVQSVADDDVAWHAPGVNDRSIGIEHAGYAKQTVEEWLDEFSTDMLQRSAQLCAWLCAKHSIPATFVNARGLLRGEAGVTTHHEVSKAFKRSDHTDPGPAFPMDWFLDQIAGG